MNDESKIFGITIRAYLALILVMCACYLMIVMKEVEKLFGLAMMALGFYFGQKSVPTIPGGPDAKITSSTTVTSVSPNPAKGASTGDDKPTTVG